MEFDYSGLGSRIASRRKQMDMKQNILAEQIGISNNYLSGIERGKENPSLDILIKLCNALEVTPDYLLLGSMRSNNIPQNITEGLRLCSKEDVEMVYELIQILIKRNGKRWSKDNFV